MPRIARIVAPGVAHHITQRGTARQLVFRTNSDRRVYMRLLREQAAFGSVSILAYCLMPNHVHLVAVPHKEDALAVVLRRVHGRYAQYFNARRARIGHLWQNRFYSCAMGVGHLWAAIRYVETNPVRSGMVGEAEAYEWSSAEAHFSGQDRWRVLDMGFYRESGGAEAWRRLYGEPVNEATYEALRKATHAGQPIGDEEFAEDLLALRRERRQAAEKAASVERRGEAAAARG